MQEYLVNAVVTLFVAIDPIALAPIFAALTAGRTVAERRTIALQASAIAAGVLVAFALFGQMFINALGISLDAFRIAGGLLLFATAFEMVYGRRDERKSATAEAHASDDDSGHVAAFPLAIPLMAGPGAITATILLDSRAPDTAAAMALVAIILLMIAACFVTFLAADRIDRALGRTGRVVLGRLLGLVLAALSVQFVADGVLAIARSG